MTLLLKVGVAFIPIIHISKMIRHMLTSGLMKEVDVFGDMANVAAFARPQEEEVDVFSDGHPT